MKVCGIDPGMKGGLSIIEDEKLIDYIVMPTDEEGIDFNKVASFFKYHLPDVVYIELVHSMPKQGVSSTWTFGFGTGGLHGVARGLGFIVKTVTPQKWQKTLMGEGKHEKSDTIRFIKQKYPEVNLLATKRSKKESDGLADSIAISLFSYLQEKIKN